MIQMPKACISCTKFEAKGKRADEHCPFKNSFTGQRGTRTQYGHCNMHSKAVYGTEICNSYEQDDLIEVVEVENRPEPLEPHQELIFS